MVEHLKQWHLQGERTVEMIPGIKTTGYFASNPLDFISSPTRNSRPSFASFHGSGMLLLKRSHSVEKSNAGMTNSYSSSRT